MSTGKRKSALKISGQQMQEDVENDAIDTFLHE